MFASSVNTDDEAELEQKLNPQLSSNLIVRVSKLSGEKIESITVNALSQPRKLSNSEQTS